MVGYGEKDGDAVGMLFGRVNPSEDGRADLFDLGRVPNLNTLTAR
jgi:hypothetical protein